MTALVLRLSAERVDIAADSAVSFGRPGERVAKLLPLPTVGGLITGRGSLALLCALWQAAQTVSAASLDDMAEALADMWQPVAVDNGRGIPAPEMVLSGPSPRLGRMRAVLFDGAERVGVNLPLGWHQAPDGPSLTGGLVESGRQLVTWCSGHPDRPAIVAFNGPLQIARLTSDGLALSTVPLAPAG